MLHLLRTQELGLGLKWVRVLVHRQELGLGLEQVRGLVHRQEQGLDLELVQDLVHRPEPGLGLEREQDLAHKQELGLELPGLEMGVQPSIVDSMLRVQWFPLGIVPEPVDSALAVGVRRGTVYLLLNRYYSLEKTLELEDHFLAGDRVDIGLAEQHSPAAAVELATGYTVVLERQWEFGFA